MYLLQAYLRNGGTLEELAAKYAISAKRHKTYNNLVLLKYDQIESPFDEPLVCEARGIILDEADNWRVVCKTFNKFFNYGEGRAAPIDWATARVQEKVDGSLTTIYHYDDKWHVATSGTPDAGGEVSGWGFTFAELFWKTFNAMGLPLPANKDANPSFELTSPYNRIVVVHKDAGLTFIGLHDRLTGEEAVLETMPEYPAVKSYPLQTVEEITATFDKMSPISQEGYVVVDVNFNRQKIKAPAYVALHQLKDGWGPRRITEIIRSGESSEITSYFPEYAEQLTDIKERYDVLVSTITADYDRLKDIEVQKDFALEAVKTVCSAALFNLRNARVKTVRQFLAETNIKTVMVLLKVKDTSPDDAV